MGRPATNGEIVALLQGHIKLTDERHGEALKRLDEIVKQTRETNGRVTVLEQDVAVLRAAREDNKPPRTALKISGGTGLGIVLTKALEWLQK